VEIAPGATAQQVASNEAEQGREFACRGGAGPIGPHRGRRDGPQPDEREGGAPSIHDASREAPTHEDAACRGPGADQADQDAQATSESRCTREFNIGPLLAAIGPNAHRLRRISSNIGWRSSAPRARMARTAGVERQAGDRYHRPPGARPGAHSCIDAGNSRPALDLPELTLAEFRRAPSDPGGGGDPRDFVEQLDGGDAAADDNDMLAAERFGGPIVAARAIVGHERRGRWAFGM